MCAKIIGHLLWKRPERPLRAGFFSPRTSHTPRTLVSMGHLVTWEQESLPYRSKGETCLPPRPSHLFCSSPVLLQNFTCSSVDKTVGSAVCADWSVSRDLPAWVPGSLRSKHSRPADSGGSAGLASHQDTHPVLLCCCEQWDNTSAGTWVGQLNRQSKGKDVAEASERERSWTKWGCRGEAERMVSNEEGLHREIKQEAEYHRWVAKCKGTPQPDFRASLSCSGSITGPPPIISGGPWEMYVKVGAPSHPWGLIIILKQASGIWFWQKKNLLFPDRCNELLNVGSCLQLSYKTDLWVEGPNLVLWRAPFDVFIPRSSLWAGIRFPPGAVVPHS